MFEIEFHEDSGGNSDLAAFISQLCEKSKTTKDARIVFTKIVAYLNILQEKGTAAGMPILRHIQDGIWELRPVSYRILFAKVEPNRFVLMHHFRKTTKRTPRNEIEKAKRELADYMRRKENEDMERLQKGTEHNRR